jgi:enoyl-CoA hydratase/carnithine racemase
MADPGTTGLVNITFPSAGVAMVSLNLPRVRNAMTAELTEAWVVAMDTVRADRGLRAVVVTGAGTAFCSGADLSWLDQGSRTRTPRTGCGRRCSRSTGPGWRRAT